MAAASVAIQRTLKSDNVAGFPATRVDVVCDFTPSTSYPANGEPMTPSLFGLQSVFTVVPAGFAGTTAALAHYDGTNNKLRLYSATDGSELSGDQSLKVVRLVVTGSA